MIRSEADVLLEKGLLKSRGGPGPPCQLLCVFISAPCRAMNIMQRSATDLVSVKGALPKV